ncbi:MAG: BON domain-containing protein [Candidatus Goldiibacteriota bacterium]
MKKMFVRVLIVIFVIAVNSAVYSMSRPAQEKIDDETLENVINGAFLADEFVSSHLIDIDVSEGVADLTGTVSDILQKERAEEIASTVKGVRAIVNRIKVKSSVDDAEIKKNIGNAVRYDPAIEISDLKISVEDGEVTLSGTADSWSEKILSGEAVKGVRGVKKVINNLSINYEGERTDSEIKAEIEKRLRLDPYVDHELFTVRVNDGNVALVGTAGTLVEESRAVVNSRVNGVQSVDATGITIREWAEDLYKRKDSFVFKSEEEIKQAVKDALYYDPRVLSGNIKIETELPGRVTLAGEVFDLRAKNAAEADARNVPGVKTVQNFIKVRPAAPLSDKAVENSVKNALLFDPVVERYDIKVDVVNNKVFLSGSTDTNYEKFRAESIAMRINGVADVKNNIETAPGWKWKSDRVIKNDLENRLEWNVFVDESGFDVRVENGIAAVEGKADTWREFNEIVEAGFNAGAKNVITDIDIRGYGGRPRTFYERYYDYRAWPQI